MNYPPNPSSYPGPDPQWGGGSGGYPQAPMPGQGPGGKKPFRFQMWMLGALIVPVGIGFAVRDAMKADSIELGGSCSDSKHCKSHTCLTGGDGICTKTCSTLDPCPAGFSCEPVQVTLKNQGGFHDLGKQLYCMKGAGGATASSAAASASEAPPGAASAPPIASAPPPAAPTETASVAPKASAAPVKATKKKKGK